MFLEIHVHGLKFLERVCFTGPVFPKLAWMMLQGVVEECTDLNLKLEYEP